MPLRQIRCVSSPVGTNWKLPSERKTLKAVRTQPSPNPSLRRRHVASKRPGTRPLLGRNESMGHGGVPPPPPPSPPPPPPPQGGGTPGARKQSSAPHSPRSPLPPK